MTVALVFQNDLQGLASARPSASSVQSGTVYRCTDTRIWYQSDGTVWLTVMLAGAWVPLTLVSGIGSVDTTVSARSEGDVVRLKGSLLNTTGSPISGISPFATIPVGLRPAWTINAIVYGASPVEIFASGGVVGSGSLAAGGKLSLDGVTYPLA
jgi:hypothetical protein